MLAACRRAALDWADLLATSDRLHLYQPPELDIVSYFPATAGTNLAAIDAASAKMLDEGMRDAEYPVFVSTLTVEADSFTWRHPGVVANRDRARILRSVLMKPESEHHVAALHARLEKLAESAESG